MSLARIPTLLLSALAFGCCLHAEPSALPPPAPGRLVDLGGHKLHVNCAGKGAPVVVVETGFGDFSFDWMLVSDRVSAFTRICTYDRAGYAWSDPGPKPRSFAQLNLELHDALAALGEPAPYLLLGHSFGGGVVRNYASIYPNEVAGLVLADIVHEDQRIPMGPKAARIRDFATGKSIPPAREEMTASDRPKLPAAPSEPPARLEAEYKRLPADVQRLHIWASSLPALDEAEASQREWSSEYMAKLHNAPKTASLGSVPLVVLTRENGGYGNNLDVPAAEIEAERKRLQAELVQLSRRGSQVIVRSGHNMHLEAPDVVAQAIRTVVDQVRASHRDAAAGSFDFAGCLGWPNWVSRSGPTTFAHACASMPDE